ncbi:hypothetical protein ACFXKC_40195 [Streptomyces sp. NPDC059340]|uniref:hypothetical protein n=1 Tax=Streptomyces sp. NPDC059340 TaxID=3346806 RepID=UPI0036951292
MHARVSRAGLFGADTRLHGARSVDAPEQLADLVSRHGDRERAVALDVTDPRRRPERGTGSRPSSPEPSLLGAGGQTVMVLYSV